jgi:hypothetical protein
LIRQERFSSEEKQYRVEGNALQTIRAILGIAETEILGNGG